MWNVACRHGLSNIFSWLLVWETVSRKTPEKGERVENRFADECSRVRKDRRRSAPKSGNKIILTSCIHKNWPLKQRKLLSQTAFRFVTNLIDFLKVRLRKTSSSYAYDWESIERQVNFLTFQWWCFKINSNNCFVGMHERLFDWVPDAERCRC